MNKAFQETIALDKTCVTDIQLPLQEIPETLGTGPVDPDEIGYLCSTIPLRWHRGPWHLPALQNRVADELRLVSSAMQQAEEVFGPIWSDPEDDVWDHL